MFTIEFEKTAKRRKKRKFSKSKTKMAADTVSSAMDLKKILGFLGIGN